MIGLPAFVQAIRQWCSKKQNNGIHKDMRVPKTCDIQILRNTKRNPVYSQIYKADSAEEVDTLKSELRQFLVPQRKKPTPRRMNASISLA